MTESHLVSRRTSECAGPAVLRAEDLGQVAGLR
jgi:hypothetical protein